MLAKRLLLLIIHLTIALSLVLPNGATAVASELTSPGGLGLKPAGLSEVVEDPNGTDGAIAGDWMAEDLAELPSWRSRYSATYQRAEGGYRTVVSSQPMHYQDEEGQWQPMRLAFQALHDQIPGEDSFVVEHNSLRSRAGLVSPWLSAAAGEAALTWEPAALGIRTSDGSFEELAALQPASERMAGQHDEGRRLAYEGAWTKDWLVDEIHSLPDALEYSLVLQEPPVASRGAEALELRATLELLPGAQLWADGRLHQEAFRTSGSLEIRNRESQPAMVLDPVVAYEQANRAMFVPGEYVLEPGARPGSWQVTVRTPYAWWAAPERQYPAVIDPIIRVLTSTGYGSGMAWIGNTADSLWTYGEIRLGTWDQVLSHDGKGYVQFNDLPAIVNNDYNNITARLVLEPVWVGVPSHKTKPEDWTKKKVQRTTNVSYLGACPRNESEATECPAGVSLHDDRLLTSGYTFETAPSGTMLGTATLAARGNDNKTWADTLDVTDEIRAWYQAFYAWDDANGPQPGPTFMLQFPEDSCPYNTVGPFGEVLKDKPIASIFNALVPLCTDMLLGPGSVRLAIDYAAPELDVNTTWFNSPGVPSRLPGVFPGVDEPDNANHRYTLKGNAASTAKWRAVAVRGDHTITPGVPATPGVRLLGPEGFVSQPAKPAPGKTSVLYVDGTVPVAEDAELVATVLPSEQPSENYEDDEKRNYRLDYKESIELANWQIPLGTRVQRFIGLSSDQLVALREFDVPPSATLGVSPTITYDNDNVGPAQVLLIAPSRGATLEEAVINGNGAVTDLLKQQPPGSIPGGRYAIAVVNQGRPFYVKGEEEEGTIGEIRVELSILMCNAWEIPTAKYDCQPIYLPSNPDPGTTETVGSLTVYSPGTFDNTPGGPGEPGTPSDQWCTTNEGFGAPVIAATNSSTLKRWVYVAQGSLCLDSAGDLYTTADSGVGLAVPYVDQNGIQYLDRGSYKFHSFGVANIIRTDGEPNGKVRIASGINRVTAVSANTILGIQAFDRWQPFHTEAWNRHVISLDTLEHTASDRIDQDVHIFVNPGDPARQAQWQVDWRYLPVPGFQGNDYAADYNFVPTVTQDLPLHNPGEALDVASMDVRVFNNGLDDDGQVLGLDVQQEAIALNVDQFRTQREGDGTNEARVTQDAKLGGATQIAQLVVEPPSRSSDIDRCPPQGSPTACVDIRSRSYQWSGVPQTDNWALPDIHIEEPVGSMLFSQAGVLNVFSADHPSASSSNLSQSFSFDTWEATVSVKEAPCQPGEPETTVVEGQGNIALPMIGDDGGKGSPPSSPGSTAATVQFRLCETKLRQALISFGPVAPPVPVGSSGIGVTFLAGQVIIDPDSTRIELTVDFASTDQTTISSGTGTVTIDTAGMFSLDGQAKLLEGAFTATGQLDVAWSPLDVLLEANVTYKGGFIVGFMRLHGWVGQGWQGKYSWIPPTDSSFHFTGVIGATISIDKGELIDKKFFKLPPWGIGLTAQVAFGEFCDQPGCAPPYPWGVSATVKVFGYGVGVYVDKGGPEVFLGSSGKTLVDQYAGVKAATQAAIATPANALPDAAQANEVIITPGLQQQFMLPQVISSLDDVPASSPEELGCEFIAEGTGYECPFTVPAYSARAMFGASWQHGNLAVSVVKPGNSCSGCSVEITAANAISNSAVFSPTYDSESGRTNVTFAVTLEPAPVTAETWKIRLGNFGQGLSTGAQHNWGMLFAADPPAPTLVWDPPSATLVEAGDPLTLFWNAYRSNPETLLESDVKMELFYDLDPWPVPPWVDRIVSFPGSYMSAAGMGADGDPADPDVQASDANQDNVWKLVTTAIPPGTYEFTAALDYGEGPWFGLERERYGSPVSFTIVSSGQETHFYYDATDNTVASRPGDDIVVLVGDMMAEVGGSFWAPDDLTGWMKRVGDTDTYSIQLWIPGGAWQYKVAINESWDENYGLGGEPDGPNIDLEVPIGGALVALTYDANTHVISHSIEAQATGTLIQYDINPNSGSFAWNTSGLAAGTYRVGGRIMDHLHGNSSVVAWSPDTITVTDNQAPPVPVIVGSPPYQSQVIAWERDDITRDLAGFLVEYVIPDWDFNNLGYDYTDPDQTVSVVRRVLPLPRSEAWPYHRLRLGGLFQLDSTSLSSEVCVRAYDASGNVSGCDPIVVELPEGEGGSLGEVGPVEDMTVTSGERMRVEWSYVTAEPDPPDAVAGYLVSYAPTGCITGDANVIAAQGPSPIDVPDPFIFEQFLSSLSPPQWYRILVQPYTLQGMVGPALEGYGFPMNGSDGNGDGVADGWMAYYGFTNALDDADQDGLSNKIEFDLRSNPIHADSDGDGYYDGEELEWGTDLCVGADQPPYHIASKMALSGPAQMQFNAPANGTNISAQVVNISNLGGEDMQWSAVPTQPWILVTPGAGTTGESVEITVDASALPPGEYTGSVVIENIAVPEGSAAKQAPQALIIERYDLPVNLIVQPPCYAPDLIIWRIALVDGSVQLGWDGTGTAYHIYRSGDPYAFALDTPYDDVVQSPWNDPDGNAIGDPAQNFYYILEANTGCGTAQSQPMGAFDFELTPGGP